MKSRLLPLLASLFAAASTLPAATVNWTASTVTAPTDVSTTGTLVGAMEVGGGTARTVNGVNFAADPGGAGSLTLGSGTVQFGNLGSTFGDFWTLAAPGGDAAYTAALDSGRWQAGPVNGTVTLGGLTVGRAYLVQLWITDTRAGANARVRTVDGVSTTSGGPNIATGRFVADAATQVITLADAGSYGPQVNLLQVRDISSTVITTGDSGAGSLRQALIWAASVAGANTITFAPALSGQTVTLSSEIVIGDSGGVTVDASALADGVTVHGGAGTNRLFSISGAGNVTLSGMNLTGGDGAGAANNGLGGAVRNAGTLVASRCTFYGNTTAEGSGGAIYSTGSLTLTQCTVSGNSAGTFGGGLYTSGSVSLTHVTLGNNTAGDTGGAMYLLSGTLTLAHSAISGTIYNNGTITHTGTSIVQSAPVGTVNGTGTLTVADPLLAGLGDYGGPTLTMRPRASSPVRDEAATSAITTDQRGFAILGAEPDAGACEANASPPTISNIANQTIAEDTATAALAFPIGDSETAAAALTVSGSSSNPTLVPNGNITFGGSGANRTVIVTPAANRSGSATITVTVSDGLDTAQDTFLLSVVSVNDAPVATGLNVGEPYTEDTPRDLSNIVITDVDSEVTATLTLSTAAAGSFSTGTSGAVTSTYDAGAGVWSAAGPVANVNALLAGVAFLPAANFDASFTIAASVSDGEAPALTGTKNMTAIPVNDAPTISAVADQLIQRNTATGSISFTVGDLETAAASLTVTGVSLNTALVPHAGVVITAGADGARMVVVTPAGGQSGTATIRLAVTDANSATAVEEFVLTVNAPPAIGVVAAQSINEDANTGDLAFTVSDAETAAGSLTVSPTFSSNTTLVPLANVVVGGSAGNRTVRVTPAANLHGTATITLTVADGSGGSSSSAFTVTVAPVNDPPTFTKGADQAHLPDAGPQTVPGWATALSKGPANESTQTLTGFTIASNSNAALFSVPPAVALNGTLTYTLAAGVTGAAIIGVTLSDNGGGTSTSAVQTFVIRIKLPISVTNANDTGAGSMRQAVTTAAASPGGDFIHFAPGLSDATIALVGEIALNDDLTIDASSLPHSPKLSGRNANRIFSVSQGRIVSLHGLILVSGKAAGPTGYGGAIYNQGKLTMTKCTLSANSADSIGGAIRSDAGSVLTLHQCTLSGNMSRASSGAISNSGVLTMTRCTLSGNSIIASDGSGVGGGISNNNNGTLTMTHCTLTANSARTSGGALNLPTGSTTHLANCIIAGNSASGVGPDILAAGGILTRSGVNLIGNNQSAESRFPDSQPNTYGDYVGTNASPLNPQLAPLANKGGPTQTCALLSNSPAINRITTPLFPTDQRGFPVVGAADSGAYEFGSASIAPIADQAILPDTQAMVPYGLFREVGAIITVTSSNQTLLPDAAIARSSSVAGINETGTLTLTPAAGQFGSTTITLSVTQGSLTVTETFVLRVGSISPPEIAPLADVTVFEDQSSDFFPLVITDADSPPEAIVLSYTTSDPQLVNWVQFQDGQFRVLPGWNLSGTASITISASDGLNTASRTFQFTVVETNDPPAFTAGGHFWLPPGSGAQTVTEWATGISAGPSDESSQTLAFTVTTDNDALFSVLPAVSPAGTLTFTPAPGQTGAANVTVTLTDSGSSTAPSDNVTSRTLRIAIREPLLVTTAAGDNSPGSLLDTIALASSPSWPGPDAIRFAPSLSGQTITLSDQISIQSPHDLEIDATALPQGLTLDAGLGTNRHFEVGDEAQLILRGLTLTGGDGNNGQGGSIENSGRLTADRCTFFGNTANYDGGAIRNASSESVLHATHCTFSGNRTLINSGGAIRNNGHATLIHCTLAGNTSNSLGGAVDNNLGHLLMTGCIMAGNTAGSGFDLDNSGTVTLTGGNLVTTLQNSGTITGPDPLTADPLLAPLANYGGSTLTMALLPGSPARDAATGSTITSDQRGFPIIGVPDIGAYEAGTMQTYAVWAAETLAPTDAAADDTADFDADSLSSTWEYATGSDPYAYTPDPLSVTPAPGGGMVFEFPWNPNATDVFYAIQQSGDLETWDNLYYNTRREDLITRAPGVTSEENPATGRITVTVPAAIGARTFWRLYIERL